MPRLMRSDRVRVRSQAIGAMSSQSVVERLRDQWRGPPVAQLLESLEAYAGGNPLDDCAILAECLTSTATAQRLLSPLIDSLCSALREHPFAHVPLRHRFARGVSVLELVRSAGASMSLVVYETAAFEGKEAAHSIAFADEERHELCLSGAGNGRIATVVGEREDRVVLDVRSFAIEPQSMLAFDCSSSRIIDRVDGHLAMLRLARLPQSPGLTREFRLSDGRLLHCASGCRRDSRDEMAVALLGRMNRRDAAEPLAAIACGKGAEHLRWQAVRNSLALDSLVGFAALEVLVGKDGDELSVPAAKLYRQLVEQYPELARTEKQPCLT